MITNDAIILGMLVVILALVFHTSSIKTGIWPKFYTYVPSLLLCYFIPSLLNTFGLVNAEESQLYHVASRYLLPASLVLLTLSTDFKGIIGLGPKAIIMFLTGTIGVVIGGPIAFYIIHETWPDLVSASGSDAVWRGMTTIAGSWIGGGANQAAMKEVFSVGDEIFSVMIAVDVIVANIWMAFLLYGAGVNQRLDNWLKADNSAISALKTKLADYEASIAIIPRLNHLMILVGTGLGITGLAHWAGDGLASYMGAFAWARQISLSSSFFWIIVLATTGGLILSFTPARKWEGYGASKMGSVFLYVLVATIGLKMDISAVFSSPGLFLLGGIWIAIHALLLIGVAKLIRAPFFFVAVGSQANIGGAASAPIVASAFHPSLAPVGVLLAVLGYTLGTYGAWICGLIMQAMHLS